MRSTATAVEMNGPFLYDDKLTADCVAEGDATVGTPKGGACEALFHEHSTHYRREPSEDRFQRFVKNVQIVNEHNKRGDVTHQITLNQFSDLQVDELPLFSLVSSGVVWNQTGQEANENVVHLSSVESILTAATHGDRRRLERRIRNFPVDPNVKWFSINSEIVDEMQGHRIHIKKRKEHNTEAAVTDDLTDSIVQHGENFDMYLNWATRENPDGVSIVHEATDQVRHIG